jgi:RND family efflux transporter MFP subunit
MNRSNLTAAALIALALAVAVAFEHSPDPAEAAAGPTAAAAPPQAVPVSLQKPAAPERAADGMPTTEAAPDGAAATGNGGGANTSVATANGGGANTSVATANGGGVADKTADPDIRGVVRAVREATLSSRLAARIEEMPLAEGTSFKSGALLVRFDCERQNAEARAASAAAEAQKKTVDTNVELDKFESIGKNDLAISRSVLDKAQAESDALKSQVKDCNLYAPFAGRVTERLAHNYEAVTVSQPLLRIVDTSALELDVIVPSAWLRWLTPGADFEFRIDETGQVMTAKVARMNPAVDPVSKTIRVIGEFHSAEGLDRVLPGMSGTAMFPRTHG